MARAREGITRRPFIAASFSALRSRGVARTAGLTEMAVALLDTSLLPSSFVRKYQSNNFDPRLDELS